MTDSERAETIRAYWRERGCMVDAGLRQCIVETPTGHTYPYKAVRSDLVNGLPMGYRGELAVSVGRKRRAR